MRDGVIDSKPLSCRGCGLHLANSTPHTLHAINGVQLLAGCKCITLRCPDCGKMVQWRKLTASGSLCVRPG